MRLAASLILAAMLALPGCARISKKEDRGVAVASMNGWGVAVINFPDGTPEYIMLRAPEGVDIFREEWSINVAPTPSGRDSIRLLRRPQGMVFKPTAKAAVPDQGACCSEESR